MVSARRAVTAVTAGKTADVTREAAPLLGCTAVTGVTAEIIIPGEDTEEPRAGEGRHRGGRSMAGWHHRRSLSGLAGRSEQTMTTGHLLKGSEVTVSRWEFQLFEVDST